MSNGDAWAFFAVAAVVVAAVGGWMLGWASAWLAGHGQGGPGRWLLDRGQGPRWSSDATVWALGLGAVVGLALLVAGRALSGVLAGREWTDSLARSMSSRSDEDEMTAEAVARDTARLGSSAAGVGVRLGISTLTRRWLYSTYEWSQVWIMGTRAGKTRAVAVPQLVEHTGPAVTTSNKPDIVYLTRGPRSELGQCWVQDPQGIYGEGATWWWNPLSFVTSLDRAEELAAIWLASRSSGEVPGAEDDYFGPMGRELLTDLLMAAALGGEQVTRVLEWLQFPDGRAGSPDPQEILRGHGLGAVADNIESKVNAAADERSGIYGTARSAVGFLRNPEYLPWITSEPGDERPEFSPEAFAGTTQTLYLLSKGGKASGARAITGSLTAAVYAAFEGRAERAGGRLATPVLFVLDEAANVCRWPELPSLYSHAGGKGIILIVILQSRKQGEGAWGVGGFGMMWSAANIAFAGRGLNDVDHLADLSRLVGDRQIRDKSVTVSGHGRSTSTQNRDERILSEADLRALPRGRGVLLSAGSRPIMLELVDLSQREDAERIAASEAAFRLSSHVEDAEDETAAVAMTKGGTA
ncbi:type IV secretory system conjugative DNA transfer family protein [Nocardioides pacificus]